MSFDRELQTGNAGEMTIPQTPAAQMFDVLDRHRFRELDGLRGIASLTVGFNHAIVSVVAVSAVSLGSLVAGVVNGALAVDLFFVMSGFFLTGMIEGVAMRGWPKFYLRRLARLAPPAMVSAVLVAVYAKFLLGGQTTHAASGDFTAYVRGNLALSWRDLALNAALIRHTINPVLWTIRIEIMSSLLFPVLLALQGPSAAAAYRLAIFVGLVAIAFILRAHLKAGLDVLHYLYIFYAGALVRDFGPRLAGVGGRSAGAIFAAALASMLLFAVLVPVNGGHPIAFDLPVSLFGAIAIAALAYGAVGPARSFMNASAVQFLGRISYSYYLVNFLFVQGLGGVVLTWQWPDRIGPGQTIFLLAGSSTLLSLAAASLFHLAVERPCTAFSRYLGKNPA